MQPHYHLLQIVQRYQLLAPAQLQQLQDKIKSNKLLSLDDLIEQCNLSSTSFAQACADFFALTCVDLKDFSITDKQLSILDETFIKQHTLLPIEQTGNQLKIALSDPTYFSLIESVQFKTGLPVQAFFAPHDQLRVLINQLFCQKHYSPLCDTTNTSHLHENPPIIHFVQQVLEDAHQQQASDIHFEAYQNYYRIRLRIDGLLHEIMRPLSTHSPAIASRLKVIAALDIAQRRLPQDGRFQFIAANGKQQDCRISTCPTLYGEKIVVRLLNTQHTLLRTDKLGMAPRQQQQFLAAIKKPQGLILVTGPTGSGKTVTLYSALHLLNQEQLNISTIEEPVEIEIPGINQVHVNHEISLDFSRALRCFLRQDPDVIMIGEIRDAETAEIAIKAAQTGHLVFTTLHTNSAHEALNRLMHLGIANFHLASSVSLITAQRLLRKLCQHCKAADQLPQEALLQFGFKTSELANLKIFKAVGCPQCSKGYRGRTGIHEIITINDSLRQQLMAEKFEETPAPEKLQMAALNKIRQGITSLEEMVRVI